MKTFSFVLGLIIFGLSITAPVAEARTVDRPVLTVYTYDSFSSDWGPGPKIKSAFEKQCNCDLKFVATDSSTGILSRVQLEGQSSPADIVLGLDATQLTKAKATGLLVPHGVDIDALTLPVNWKDDTFLPFDYGYFAFVYDQSKLEEVPENLDALASSSLKIIIEDPRSSTPGLGLLLWLQAVKGDQAAAYWAELADNIVTVTKGWSEAYGLFLEGEADMVLSYTTSPAYHMIAEQKSQYRAASFSEGHGMQIEVAAKLKNAPQPALADSFMAFILSDEFQSVIPTGNWMYPVTSVPLPDEFAQLVQPTKGLIIDAEKVSKHKKAWLADFTRGLSN
jgi:thiamine transport system substrate-binding protein